MLGQFLQLKAAMKWLALILHTREVKDSNLNK